MPCRVLLYLYSYLQGRKKGISNRRRSPSTVNQRLRRAANVVCVCLFFLGLPLGARFLRFLRAQNVLQSHRLLKVSLISPPVVYRAQFIKSSARARYGYHGGCRSFRERASPCRTPGACCAAELHRRIQLVFQRTGRSSGTGSTKNTLLRLSLSSFTLRCDPWR